LSQLQDARWKVMSEYFKAPRTSQVTTYLQRAGPNGRLGRRSFYVLVGRLD
jgi:hypothetical protein